MVLAVVATLAAWPACANNTLYRYRNHDNVLVIDFSIPPEFAVNGYEVITPDGRVLQTVPPVSEMPSAEQRARNREQQRIDQFILRSYSTVDDVHRARDRRLTQVERDISILESNIAEYQRRHRQLRDQAASFQASGAAPPEATETVIRELREQESSTEQLLAERRAQHQQLITTYDYYARRLVELKGEGALGDQPDEPEHPAAELSLDNRDAN